MTKANVTKRKVKEVIKEREAAQDSSDAVPLLPSPVKLEKVKKQNEVDQTQDEEGDGEDSILLQTIMLTIPLTTLHVALDYVVHMQYDFTELYNLSYFFSRTPPFMVALALLIYITSMFRKLMLMQLILAILSCASGVFLVQLSEGNETFGNMQKTPGLAVLWIYTVIQMNLSVALASLAVPLVYYFYNKPETPSPMTNLT
ncbi:hypothetical protein HDV05_007625 [Chytridiales sp. JEL 0842]|nr:hypothetical protein HDV05_007625 [Chytridiales sp. JEL 0842]